ncbi:MAG: cell division protein ZapD [Gammaproteobacteria bacterium]|nr:cell division protein ZapD [Gammaproteobacteria bacterium]MCP5423736.1 cell division protein ZapD [Gammaproteobacteria bacterium]MCP5459682.1 cell division protein ZapD [Gammaproteobacteria bacterium]
MPICYEHPLNERIRVLLRLEVFFRQIAENVGVSSEWSGFAALQGLFGICGLTSRAELKTELLKELERQSSTLANLRAVPNVDTSALDDVLARLSQVSQSVQELSNPAQEEVRKLDLLNTIRQRSSMPGATGAFDLPALHHWLRQDSKVHIRYFDEWLVPFKPLQDATALLLQLIRDSAVPEEDVAIAGLYQKSLSNNSPNQLVRVFLPAGSWVFPEISGSKHRFSVRFMEQDDFNQRPRQTSANVTFNVACCTF